VSFKKTRRVAGAALLAGALTVVGVQASASSATEFKAPGGKNAVPPTKIGHSKGKPTIVMSGSTSVAPLAALLAQKYVQTCGHCVNFRLLQGGSDVGVADVAHQRVTIGNSSRDPKPTDPGGITFNSIARDAICVVTNKDNHLPGLDQNGVQQIFGGNVVHWNDVPGAGEGNDAINLYVRTAASGTQDAFQKIFMNPVSVSNTAKQLSSNGLVQQRVKDDKDGIGYVSLYFAKGTHAVPYKGVACNLRNAKSLQYGGIRTFYMVTNNDASGPEVTKAHKWIKWIQKSKKAKKIIGTQWVPLH